MILFKSSDSMFVRLTIPRAILSDISQTLKLKPKSLNIQWVPLAFYLGKSSIRVILKVRLFGENVWSNRGGDLWDLAH